MEVISPVTSTDFGMGFPITQPNPFPATVPFAWEDKPGVPNPRYKFLEQDFAFDVSREVSYSDSVSADDLFDGGVIKLLEMKTGSSSRSRRTQSFSAHRGWEVPWEEPEKQQSVAPENIKPQSVSSCSTLSASSSTKGSKKWSLRNLFLFRSVSDGRAMDRDPLKKYSSMFTKHDEDFINIRSSVRSIEPQGARSWSGSKKREPVSAHELHYKVNRAVANEMKKKTFLPYKQGILGRSAFNPSVHALSRVYGSV